MELPENTDKKTDNTIKEDTVVSQENTNTDTDSKPGEVISGNHAEDITGKESENETEPENGTNEELPENKTEQVPSDLISADNSSNNETETISDETEPLKTDQVQENEIETSGVKEKKAVKPKHKAVKHTAKKNEAELKPAEKRWYAIRTITGHEKRVKNYLESEIPLAGLESKITQVLIPEEKVFEVKGGKKKIKYKNFFPGYILAETILDAEVINFISRAPSVLKMVGDKNEIVPLRESEIKRILGRINESDEQEKIDIQFEKGDLVKVISGPFVSFNGTINEINFERMKVKVMVSIFGRKTPIELDFAQIEKEK